MPFFAVGAFAVQLPKSGAWMVHVKSILGVVLVVVALHFASTVLPVLTLPARASLPFFLGIGVAVVVGVLLGAVHRQFVEPGMGIKVMKGLGVVLLAGGLFLGLEAAIKPPDVVTWEHQLEVARGRARRESRPMLVDFGAAWCAACKELDKVTFLIAAGRAGDGALRQRQGRRDQHRRSARGGRAGFVQGGGVADGGALRFTR